MPKKVIFMGTPDFAVPILDTLINDKDIEIVLVISKPDALVGRKKILQASPVKKEALKYNLRTLEPLKIKDSYEEILNLHPDLIITCAYGQIVPKNILEIPVLGCINVHASLLPKYRGGAPIHWAIINGEDKSGITIMYMDENMDTGDIIAQREVVITKNDTVASLHDKLSILGANLLKETLPSILKQTNMRKPQDNNLASYAPTIKREDEHLDFKTKAINIYNKVRGLNSWPLANILIDNEEIKILEGYIGEDTNKEASHIVCLKKEAIGISCQDKIYYVTKLKPSGKKAMSAKEYLNGINKERLLNKEVK